MHQGADSSGRMPQVDDPLVEPGGLQRPRSHFGKRTSGVRAAKRTEPVFGPRAVIGVSRIQGSAYPRKHHKGDIIRLIEDVNVGVCREVPAHPDETVGRVKDQLPSWHEAVLDALVLADRSHVIGPALANRHETLILLAHGLCAEKRRLHHELRNVRPLNGTVARNNLSAEQVLRRYWVRKFAVLLAAECTTYCSGQHRLGPLTNLWRSR